MYRYRDERGATVPTLERVERHLHKVGEVTLVRGYCYHGRYNTNHTAVMVKGTKGTARFSGFSWGYDGTGPRGLKTLLKRLNVDQAEITRVLAAPWDGWDKVGEAWRINLTPTNEELKQTG